MLSQLALGIAVVLVAASAVAVPLAVSRRMNRRTAAPIPPPPEGSKLWMPDLAPTAPTSPDVAAMEPPPKPWDALDRDRPGARAVIPEQRAES